MRILSSSALALGLVCVSWCAGQEGEKANPAVPGKLDPPALERMLADLGHEVKHYGTSKAPGVVLMGGGRTYPTTFSFSRDNTMLYFESFLIQMQKGEEMTAAAALELLAANDDFIPSYFSYLPDSRWLLANRAVPNQNLTPKRIRLHLEGHLGMLVKTAPRWVAPNLVKPYAPPKQNKETVADLTRLEGIWVPFEREQGGVKYSPKRLKTLVLYAFKDGRASRFYSDAKTPDERFAIYFDATAKPSTLDLVDQNGSVFPGIYRIEGDELWFCFGPKGGARPKQFVSAPMPGLVASRERVRRCAIRWRHPIVGCQSDAAC